MIDYNTKKKINYLSLRFTIQKFTFPTIRLPSLSKMIIPLITYNEGTYNHIEISRKNSKGFSCLRRHCQKPFSSETKWDKTQSTCHSF